jgi:23S rRNA (guanosine2251-2'-O)-methyltransferase
MKKTDSVYGIHAVESLVASQPGSLVMLTVAAGKADPRLTSLVEQAESAAIPVKQLPRKDLDRMFPGGRHQGVVATITVETREMTEKSLPAFLESLQEPAFLLVLDGVQDPHNLGACLRTADAAGVHAVIMPRDRAVGITPVVHKVASGAVQSVPVFTVTNLARTLRELKDLGIWIYGASDAAEQLLYSTDLGGPAAFVLGGEGKGLRRLTRELCDHLVAIPMAGRVESLNVSVAAGVLLFEARRQRGAKQ